MTTSIENRSLAAQPLTPALNVLSELMPSVSENTLGVLLKHAYLVVEKKPLPPKFLEKLAIKNSTENYENIFGGLLVLLQTILREKPDSVKENDLRLWLKALKFSEDSSNAFINLYLENRDSLYMSRKLNVPYYHRLKKFDWRIDISLASSMLNRSVKTLIIVTCLLENGKTVSFELTVAKFHVLRLYVASMLRDVLDLEKKAIFAK